LIFQAADTDGKKPNLLLSPNREDPSYRMVNERKYFLSRSYFRLPKYPTRLKPVQNPPICTGVAAAFGVVKSGVGKPVPLKFDPSFDSSRYSNPARAVMLCRVANVPE
jgi:hypothetical protein